MWETTFRKGRASHRYGGYARIHQEIPAYPISGSGHIDLVDSAKRYNDINDN